MFGVLISIVILIFIEIVFQLELNSPAPLPPLKRRRVVYASNFFDNQKQKELFNLNMNKDEPKIIIAIDGHSSCGKSTLAKELSKTLGYGYVDTGAMYRAITLYFIQHQVDITEAAAVTAALKKISITFVNKNGKNRTILNNKDVEEEIRQMYVSEMVSPVATISSVRKAMVKQQQEMGQQKGIILDGRDIGTVVFPNAALKLFVTATIDTRAKRRYLELTQKGMSVKLEEVAGNLAERDQIDSNRADSPLKQADDAILIDNTNLSRVEQLAMVLALVKVRIADRMQTKLLDC